MLYDLTEIRQSEGDKQFQQNLGDLTPSDYKTLQLYISLGSVGSIKPQKYLQGNNNNNNNNDHILQQ